MAELLSYAETKKLLDDLPAEHKKLVEELIPSQIPVTGVQRVLQTLLAERVSIRDLSAILEGIVTSYRFLPVNFNICLNTPSRISEAMK